LAPKIPAIDTEACIACGNCKAVCPEVFRLNENLGHSEVINPTGAPKDRIQEAIDQCLVQCIYWQESTDWRKTHMPFPPNYDNLTRIFR